MSNSYWRSELLQGMADGYVIVKTFRIVMYITLAMYFVLYYWVSKICYFGVYLGYILSSDYTREPEFGRYRRKCRRLTNLAKF